MLANRNKFSGIIGDKKKKNHILVERKNLKDTFDYILFY